MYYLSSISAPVARTFSGIIALTVAAVPTGINAGVRILPFGVFITPVRARPSVALILNFFETVCHVESP